MPANPSTMFAEHFAELKDPRIDRTKLHPLINILVIALCAAICGADNWVEIELFGPSKREWFARFLDLTNDIPSHDTYGRLEIRECWATAHPEYLDALHKPEQWQDLQTVVGCVQNDGLAKSVKQKLGTLSPACPARLNCS